MDWFLYDNGLRHERIKKGNEHDWFIYHEPVELILLEYLDVSSENYEINILKAVLLLVTKCYPTR